jgi:MFS superfamily sulfate permease-like transporter
MTSARRKQVECWVPGVRVARTYERRWLRPDLIAGLVLAAILVPFLCPDDPVGVSCISTDV